MEARQPWAGFGMVTELRPGNGIHTVAVKVTVNPFEPEGLKWKCQGHCFIGFSGGDQIYVPQRRPGPPLSGFKSRRLCRMNSLSQWVHWFIWMEIGLGPSYSGHLGVAKAPAWFVFYHFHTQLFYLLFLWHFRCNHSMDLTFPSQISTQMEINSQRVKTGIFMPNWCFTPF